MIKKLLKLKISLLTAALFVCGLEGKAIKKTTTTAITPTTEVTEEIQAEPTPTTMPSRSKTVRKNTVTVNGQSVSCNGSVTVTDGEFFCDGKKVKPTAMSPETKKIIDESQALTEQSHALTEQARTLTEQAQRTAKQYPTKSKKMTGRGMTSITKSGTVTVNGRSVPCNGSVSVINDEVFCNGKKVLPKK